MVDHRNDCGGMIVMTLDLLLGAPPLDKYDINDNGYVEWFDMLLYLAYPPFGFLFLHGYTRLRTPAGTVLIYVVLFSFFSIGVEWLSDSAGVPMAGDELRGGLRLLARDFDRMAVPEHGRYVDSR